VHQQSETAPASGWFTTRPPPVTASRDFLRRKERTENFPVALIVLPGRFRKDLRRIYQVVRVIDELGDSAPGDRTALLTDFAADLRTVWSGGEPSAAVLRRLVPTVQSRLLSRQPFEQLIEANLVDQRTTEYRSWADLLHYCSLSAAPIGRLVLQVFGQDSTSCQVLSDQVCAALQLLEHWQDIAEDRRAGRIYLPRQDMDRFGVPPERLDAGIAAPELKRLVRYETDRAAELLDSGAVLVGQLSGWVRLAVAGYVAGGYATVRALRRCDGDVLVRPPRPRRRDVLLELGTQLRISRV
jgi:squalene synthase HpnC